MYRVKTIYNNYDEIEDKYKPYKSNGIVFLNKKSAEEYIEYLERRTDIIDIELIEE